MKKGIVIFFLFILLGGLSGIFMGYFMIQNHENIVYTVQKTYTEETSFEDQNSKPQKEEPSPSIALDLSSIDGAFNTWKSLVQNTSTGDLSKDQAMDLIYKMSSHIYKRNMPKSFCMYRIQNAIQHQKGDLKKIGHSNFQYDKDNVIYVDVLEEYKKDQVQYKLKFVKENNQWLFAAQFPIIK